MEIFIKNTKNETIINKKTVTPPIIPKIGEGIQLNDQRLRVQDIIYYFEETQLSIYKIFIIVEQYNKQL